MTRPFEGVKISTSRRCWPAPMRATSCAARRRRHQGRASRRRGHAPHAAEPRMGRPRPRAGWQAINGNKRTHARSLSRGDRHRQATRRPGRRGDGEFPSRRDGSSASATTLSASIPRLIYCRHFGLGQTGPERRRLGRQDPGASGTMCRSPATPRPGRRARACGLRRPVGRHRRLRRVERAVPAHPYRQGATGRRLHAGGDAGVPVRAGRGLLGRRPSPAAFRQPGREPPADRQPVQGQ